MNSLSSWEKQEILNRALAIKKYYNDRLTISATAKRFNMKQEEVSKVLKGLYYWHGIDRMEEPIEGHTSIIGNSLLDYRFLLNYPASLFQ